MPAFASLNNEQIADIIAFLQYRIKHQSQYPGEDYPMERLLVGNAAAGRAYFFGAGGCSSCHSPTGDLAGIATRLRPVDLQQRILLPHESRRSHAGAPPPGRVSVHLSNGQTIEGELVTVDEFHVALRDQQGWYHSWPRDQVTFEIKDPLAAHQTLLSKLTDADIHNLFAYLATLKSPEAVVTK
jgi:cytochrome c oxidase cbb3-type subunit 3